MTRSEAAALLRGAGLQLGRDDVDALVHATEGWPAALSLAALTLARPARPGPAVARFGGGDRLVAEYLRDEVLAGLSADERTFVRRTSILDVLSRAGLRRVLGRPGSAAMLARLLRSGFPLVALDRTGERYRYHRLLGDMLRAELRRTEPELEAELHRRASAWHARAGDRDRGVQHALAARRARPRRRPGVGRRPELARAGLERRRRALAEPVHQRPDRRAPAARPRGRGDELAHGHGDLAEHWLRRRGGEPGARHRRRRRRPARRARPRRARAHGRDAARRRGAARPRRARARRCAGCSQASPSTCAATPSRRAAGSTTAARRAAVTAPHVQALCLAQLALLALDERDWEDAARLSTRARAQIARYGLDRYPTSALVLAVSALVRAQRGRSRRRAPTPTAAAELLERLTDLAPWHEIEVRIVLGRTALRLSDLNERAHAARRAPSASPRGSPRPSRSGAGWTRPPRTSRRSRPRPRGCPRR